MSHDKKKHKEGLTTFLCDYLPLIVFFLFYKFSNKEKPLVEATIYMVITSFFALIIGYFLTKKIAKVALFSAIILAIFGGLTVLLEDEFFIKLKPTIINLIFAAILFYGYFIKKPFLSVLFGGKIEMPNHAWLTLSFRWACFFVFLAILNEIIWRNFSTDFWVQFKVFGMTPISIIFTMMQLPFIMRHAQK